MPANPPLSPARAILAGVALWLLLSLGWSAYLLTAARHHFITTSLASRTQHLAQLLATTPPADRQSLLDQAIALDPDAAYAMLWSEDGLVLLHTNHPLAGTFLNETQWPALDPKQSLRISSPSLPTSTIPLLEATVPVSFPSPGPLPTTSPKSPRTYLSLALNQYALAAQFWQSATGLLASIAAFTLAGALLIAAGILLTLRRLQNSRREIEQNARARTSLLTERGMLASVLAHEVRSPLTALRFNLHSLRSLLPTPAALLPATTADPDAPTTATSPEIARQIELTDRCEREIHRLDGMLNDFLLRTQVVNAPDPGATTSINAVVREAIDFLMPALDRKNIHVSLHLDPADPQVHVHPDELRQVILNLAANAQDAMPPPKGGMLAISTLAAAPPPPPHEGKRPSHDTSVTILIRDSGTGIPPDLHERIFEPFFSTKPNGSGLGLALVRRVISGAGGTVFCESAPATPGNQGTTFRILLPPANTPANPS